MATRRSANPRSGDRRDTPLQQGRSSRPKWFSHASDVIGADTSVPESCRRPEIHFWVLKSARLRCRLVHSNWQRFAATFTRIDTRSQLSHGRYDSIVVTTHV
jgi:hypothetical protein